MGHSLESSHYLESKKIRKAAALWVAGCGEGGEGSVENSCEEQTFKKNGGQHGQMLWKS